MLAYNGWGYPMTPVRKNKMTDDIVEKIVMKGKAAEEIRRLRAENERLIKDVKTAIMGDSAELADVKRENEKLHREAAIRIDQIRREQDAHLRTITDYNRAMVENEKLREEISNYIRWIEALNSDKKWLKAEILKY